MKVIAIAGSLRKQSYNAALVRAAVEVAPPGLEIEIAGIAEIPLYDGDAEAAHGIPAPVAALKDRIAAADGLLLATPEYNGSIPGVAKNAFDWMSRPGADIGRVFGGRRTALMGATPGPAGTIAAQSAWLMVFRALGLDVWNGPRLHVSGAGKVFDGTGALVDDAVRRRLTAFMAGFADYLEG